MSSLHDVASSDYVKTKGDSSEDNGTYKTNWRIILIYLLDEDEDLKILMKIIELKEQFSKEDVKSSECWA